MKLRSRVEKLLARRRFAEARALLTPLLREQPMLNDTLAECYRREGRLALARKHQRAYITAGFDAGFARTDYGEILEQSGMLRRAATQFRIALRLPLRPTERIYLGLGRVFGKLGKFDESRKWFRRRLKLGRSAKAYVGLGLIAYKLEDWARAARHYRTASTLSRPSFVAAYGLAMSLYRLERWGPALRSFRKAARLDPASSDARTGIVRCTERLRVARRSRRAVGRITAG
jgi:tetratricopeptide (TPR) repeat protein